MTIETKAQQLPLHNLNQLSNDGFVYYSLILDTVRNELSMACNYGCTARLESFLSERYNISRNEAEKRFKLFHNGYQHALNFNLIPKKYHKTIKSILSKV